ncbi:MAG: hypothetical protein V7L27_24205, partial [Nostoc sp.]|uniref:hypothetical protein n=1 Tax=Nostoc sp. TaxID=1180 RepID=UPI002FF562B1
MNNLSNHQEIIHLMENNTIPSSFLPTEILPDYSTIDDVIATQYSAGDVGGVIAPTPITGRYITGREAARIQLEKLSFEPGQTFHVKLNNNIIFEGTVTKPGFFSIREQEKLLDAEGNPVCKQGSTAPFWINKGNSIYSDGWKYLEERAEVGTGLFIIPNHTQGGIGADYATDFSNLFVEIDDRPIPEQWEKINEIQSQYGLTPSLIVGSGGKSLHVYYKLATSPDAETWKVLQKKLILLFQSDPAIINLNREMRFAGFTRKAKGTQQSVGFDSEATYTVEDFEARLSSAYPHGLSEGRWDEARKALKFEGDRNAEIKRILSLPEESLAKNIKKARKAQTTTGLNYVGEGSLVDAVKYNGGKVEGSLSHAVNTWKVQG